MIGWERTLGGLQGRGAVRWGKVMPLEVETPGKWANI